MNSIPDGLQLAPGTHLSREDNDPKVYLIDRAQGTKRWITSPAVMDKYHFSWHAVQVVPPGTLSSIPTGPSITEGNVPTLHVSVTPYPVPENVAVTVTVHATEMDEGSKQDGRVIIGGQDVARTNEPFTYTFRSQRLQTGYKQWETFYPTGVVRVGCYPEAPIDFGFPEF